MSEAERKAIENGIWLCNHCARKIDIEQEAYTIKLSKDWKKKAESVKINFKPNNVKGFKEKYTKLIEDGETFEG